MHIRIESGHFRVESGRLALFLFRADALLLHAECVGPNTLTAPVTERGEYWVCFGECVITHLPSGKSGHFGNVRIITLPITEEHLASGEISVAIEERCLYKLSLLRDGVPAPGARILLSDGNVTIEGQTDPSGILTFIQDPREVFLDFEKGLQAEIVRFDENGRQEHLATVGPATGKI